VNPLLVVQPPDKGDDRFCTRGAAITAREAPVYSHIYPGVNPASTGERCDDRLRIPDIVVHTVKNASKLRDEYPGRVAAPFPRLCLIHDVSRRDGRDEIGINDRAFHSGLPLRPMLVQQPLMVHQRGWMQPGLAQDVFT